MLLPRSLQVSINLKIFVAVRPPCYGPAESRSSVRRLLVYAALANVVRDFYKGIVDADLQDFPTIERLSDGFAENKTRRSHLRLFKTPVSQKVQLWFGNSLPEIDPFFTTYG